MASIGPKLVSGEAEGVINFIIDRARKLQTRDLSGENAVSLESLAPFFIGADNPDDHFNRIRFKMRDQFKEANIKFRCKGHYYEFEIDPTVDINVVEKEKEKEKELEFNNKVETSTNFEEDFVAPAWFGDLLDTLRLGDKPILVGPQGCGKSRALEELYSRLGREIFRVALGEYRDPADLIGTKEIVNIDGVPTTKLVGGLLTELMEKGYGVILDEYDVCSPGMVAALNKVMEPGIEMVLPTEKGSIKFRPHPNTLISATANTWGYGDDTGLFSGAQMQNRASWDRLRPKMDCYYDYDIERLLVSRYLPSSVVKGLYCTDPNPPQMGLVYKIRKAIEDPANPLDDVLGLRSILWFAKRWKTFGWHKGMYYFVNEFRPENRGSISLMIKTRFGSSFVASRNDYDSTAPDYIPTMMPDLVKCDFDH